MRYRVIYTPGAPAIGTRHERVVEATDANEAAEAVRNGPWTMIHEIAPVTFCLEHGHAPVDVCPTCGVTATNHSESPADGHGGESRA